MNIAIVDSPAKWWEYFRDRVKNHDDLKAQFPRINQKIAQCIVFKMGDEHKPDGFVVLSPSSLGVTIELVWGDSPLFLMRYIDSFILLMKRVNYQYIYAIPVSESRRRLYKRFGFVGDKQNKMMVMRVR